MKESDAFKDNSQYVKAAHVEMPKVVKIKAVRQEIIGKEREERPVAYFEKARRGLILNVTNWRAIAKLYGDDSDLWVGKTKDFFSAPLQTPFVASRFVMCRQIAYLSPKAEKP